MLVVAFLLMVSCTVEPYESGDSSLSYLKAEMVDMRVMGKGVQSILSDEDEQLCVSSAFQLPQKMERNDTIYRMMLYYNKVGEAPIEIKSMRLAHVVNPAKKDKALTLADDPLKLISVWKAKNSTYLNLSLGLMIGNHYLTLHHDQDGIPEYYTQTAYVSIPMKEYAKGDKISIRMNTYSGWIEKIFAK
ncbi:MAG: NigD-like C-terminal domain-containing protein [Prevotellaceae bacterium]|nr:NigD-like C-terminal domain-containing protein [Prevotellaceae bacterium]